MPPILPASRRICIEPANLRDLATGCPRITNMLNSRPTYLDHKGIRQRRLFEFARV